MSTTLLACRSSVALCLFTVSLLRDVQNHAEWCDYNKNVILTFTQAYAQELSAFPRDICLIS